MWVTRDLALSVIAQRFEVDAPIEDEFTDELTNALLEGLNQKTSFRYFSDAAVRLIDSGMADHPGDIRDRLLEIYLNGQMYFGGRGEEVAENIERQMRARDAWESD